MTARDFLARFAPAPNDLSAIARARTAAGVYDRLRARGGAAGAPHAGSLASGGETPVDGPPPEDGAAAGERRGRESGE